VRRKKTLIKATWDLLRLEHGFMLAIAVFIGALIAGKGFLPIEKLIYACLTPIFLEAATFALNDYFDFEIDKENKRMDRPLVRGDLKPKHALIFFSTMFPLGLLFSFFVNTICFLIALLTGFLAIAYDIKMKKVKLIGNFYISYTMAIPFIFGGTVVSTHIPVIVYIIAAIAFLSGSGREIMKDIMDYRGDRKKGVKSLPIYIGLKSSVFIINVFYLSAVAISIIPFVLLVDKSYYHNYLYLCTVLLADILFVYVVVDLSLKKEQNINIYRKITLLAMFIGLIAFLLGGFT